MDIYRKAGLFIEQHTIAKPSEISESEDELLEAYANFQEIFSPEKIKSIPAESLANSFMSIQDRISLLDKTFNERVTVDENIRSAILTACEVFEKAKLSNLDDYIALDDRLAELTGTVYQLPLIYKYLAIIFKNKLSPCYNEVVQVHILNCCSILPHEKVYVRGGQLVLMSNHACMLSDIFNKLALSYFGGIKNFCKIDITNEQFDMFKVFKDKSIVAVPFKETGDLNAYAQNGQINVNMLSDNLTKLFNNNTQQAQIKLHEIMSFWNANIDTIFVVMNKGSIVAFADCIGNYHFGNDNYFAHIKPVLWKRILEGYNYLPVRDEGANLISHTFKDKLNVLFLYQQYIDIFELPDAVSSSSVRIHPLNQILYGASGSGKTYTTTEIAMAIVENRPLVLNAVRDEKEEHKFRVKYESFLENYQITFIAFHENYTYKEFIETLNPDYSPKDGLLKKMADRALTNADKNYVLIIDEINRVNISKVFGEAFALIDPDKRRGESNTIYATLASGENLFIPKNLYIVATINTVDKTLPQIDPTLRRRFEFVEILPNENLIKDEILKYVFINLNDTLYKIFSSSEILIGHSYFMDKTSQDLVSIFNTNIIPLMYDFFPGDTEKIKQIIQFSAGNYIALSDNRFGRMKAIPLTNQQPAQPAPTAQTAQPQPTQQPTQEQPPQQPQQPQHQEEQPPQDPQSPQEQPPQSDGSTPGYHQTGNGKGPGGDDGEVPPYQQQ